MIPSLGPQGTGALASPPEVGGAIGDSPPADGGAPAVGSGEPAPPGSDDREPGVPAVPSPPGDPPPVVSANVARGSVGASDRRSASPSMLRKLRYCFCYI